MPRPHVIPKASAVIATWMLCVIKKAEKEWLLIKERDGFASENGQDFPQRAATFRRIQEELASEPGVASASAAAVTLMSNSNSSSTVRVEGYESKEGEDMNPMFNYVAPGFFETLGLPLVAGRDLAETDVLGAPQVAVVNEVFVRTF